MPPGTGEGKANRGRNSRSDRAEIARMVGERRRDEAPEEFRRSARADDDRLFVGGFLQRAIDVPLIDRRVRGEFPRRELVAPDALFVGEAFEARGVLFALRALQQIDESAQRELRVADDSTSDRINFADLARIVIDLND